MIALTPGRFARAYASISTSSLWAVISPLTSIRRAASATSRTSNVVAASGMIVPFGAAHGAVFVVGDRHEVGQPRDLEDLAVVARQPERPDFDAGLAGIGQQPDDQRDTRAVDVVGALEVQCDRDRAALDSVRVCLVQGILGGRIHVADEVDHRYAIALANSCAQLTRCHRLLLPGAGRVRRFGRRPRWLRAP